MRTTADIAVIGGGVLGAAVLEAAATAGLRAVMLERDMPNRQGSGTTAGNLHVQAIHAERPSQAIPVDTRALVPFQARASALWAELSDRLGQPLEIATPGGLTVAETDDQLARLHEKHVWEAEAGIPTEVIDGQTAREHVPALGPTVIAATWCPWDGWANNLTVTPAYLGAARRAGAQIFLHSAVTAIEQLSTTWLVRSKTVDVEAPVVVDAAGPWLDRVARLAGASLEMEPLAIQMLESERTAPTLRHLVQHIGEGMSVKQVAAGNVVIGGGWPAERLELCGVSPVSPASVAGNIEQVRRVLPGLRGLRLSRAWTGPLAATPDEMPLVGELSGFDGFHVVGGTYAFTFSPVWAQLTIDRILDRPSDLDASAFTPDRLLIPVPIGG